jgi:hypothetical protein
VVIPVFDDFQLPSEKLAQAAKELQGIGINTYKQSGKGGGSNRGPQILCLG